MDIPSSQGYLAQKVQTLKKIFGMAPPNQDLGNEKTLLISSHLRHECVEFFHTSVTPVYTKY